MQKDIVSAITATLLYSLDPRLDVTFVDDNPGVTPVGLDRTSRSPKPGAIWRFDNALSLFAQYARGFRAHRTAT